MADYFLLLDAAWFEQTARPALAEAWRRRSFADCKPLCRALLPAARAFADRFHTGAADPLLVGVAHGLPFDRLLWRHLVGEVLLYGAAEMPELTTDLELMCQLLQVAPASARGLGRGEWTPIEQAHQGSRELTFGIAAYRPEDAGYNHAADVARLDDFLRAVRPEQWSLELLCARTADDDDPAEALECAREWFAALAELFARARRAGQVLVHERLY